MRIVKLFAFLLLSLPLSAQELNCDVDVITGGGVNVDKRVLQELDRAITDFMSLRTWTTDKYKPEEKINCKLRLSIQKSEVGRFEADVQIFSSRAVYGSSYETVMLNYLDKGWAFEYVEGQPMDFQENTFFSNLTSLLAYYAYFIIGLDNDSFSKLGGKDMFNKAQQVATNAIPGGLSGWQPFDGTNVRYWLIENILNPQMASFREGLYTYHRLGLDKFAENPEAARAQAIDLLGKLKAIRDQRPMAILINSFVDAKTNEWIGMFKGALPQEKQQAYQLLIQIDPTKADRFQPITQ